MKIKDIITEASKDWNERGAAEREIQKMLYTADGKGRGWDSFTADEVKKAVKLSKITGRRTTMYIPGYQRGLTVGSAVDQMVKGYREAQASSGQMPEFTGRASTTRDMTDQIAMQTSGRYLHRGGRTWTTGYGDRYKDPTDHIQYPTREAYDDAWAWLESKGKKVYYRDSFKTLQTAIQIGRYIAEPASVTRGAFRGDPQTDHLISVRTAKVINQAVRTQVDMTDQQAAALKDIADTENANAMAQIQAMLAILQGQDDVKKVIASSQKLDPRDKAKLDAIISGAQNFKD